MTSAHAKSILSSEQLQEFTKNFFSKAMYWGLFLETNSPKTYQPIAFWLPRSGVRQKKIAGMDSSRTGNEAVGRPGAEARREDMCHARFSEQNRMHLICAS